MNINRTMKKLQKAIVNKGLIIKINTRQFFSEEQKRMITSYQVCTPAVRYSEEKRSTYEADFEIIKSCSIAEIVMCLSDIYKAVKVWN